MKEGGGAWKVVKEEVEEIGCESVGVVGVREALVKNKQKQDLSHTDHQQQGVVAVRNYLTEPKDDKKDDDDLIRRPSSGIVGVRGYMAWDQGNLCKSLNEGVKTSTDENCGIVGVKDSMTSADKATNVFTNEGEMNYPDDHKEKSMDLGMIKGIQNVESNERNKADSHGDIVTSENIRSHLDDKSVIKNLKETSKNTSETDKDTRETSKDTRETSKDTRETDKELSTFINKTYIELVSFDDDNENNINNAVKLDSYVDDKQQDLSSQDEADDKKQELSSQNEVSYVDDKEQELSSQNEGQETLAEQSETSLGQPLTATGAKGTKYTMSFLTKGRRFSGDKKKLSN